MFDTIKQTWYPVIELAFAKLELWANKKSMAFALCRDCGKNPYYSAPCKGGKEV